MFYIIVSLNVVWINVKWNIISAVKSDEGVYMFIKQIVTVKELNRDIANYGIITEMLVF